LLCFVVVVVLLCCCLLCCVVLVGCGWLAGWLVCFSLSLSLSISATATAICSFCTIRPPALALSLSLHHPIYTISLHHRSTTSFSTPSIYLHHLSTTSFSTPSIYTILSTPSIYTILSIPFIYTTLSTPSIYTNSLHRYVLLILYVDSTRLDYTLRHHQ
jgi:hypothetical protein